MQNATASDVSEPQTVILELNETVERLTKELELANWKYDQLRQYIFGKRSEKRIPESSSEQISIFEQEEIEKPSKEEEYITVPEHKKRKRNTKKHFPKDLPVNEVVYEPTECNCADCGTELKEFSRDEREEIDFKPASFYKTKIIKVNKSCPKCKTVWSGKVPNPVIPGTQLGAGFFAYLITSRFCDHLPYYRQSQIYARQGVIIPDKNLSAYAMQLGALLEPVAKEIKRYLLSLGYVQADETRIEVLAKIKTNRGWLWVLNDPHSSLSYYEFRSSRSKDDGKKFLSGYSGTLQTDAYSAYDDYKGLSLGCMAHARRKFIKAQKLAPKDCKKILSWISELYKIERTLNNERVKLKSEQWCEKRLKLRQEKSVPILEELKKYLIKIKDSWLIDDHPMTKAINYMLCRYETFSNYTKDGKYQIDNNDIERIIRPIAVGRKNWLFAGSEHGARMSAVMMTVVQTCKQFKINPQEYLADVLPKLVSQETKSLQGITPMDWKSSS